MHTLVVQHQSSNSEHPLDRDQILAEVLGVRSGYVRGKGYGKEPIKKKDKQTDVEATISSAVEEVEARWQQKLNEQQIECEARWQQKLNEQKIELLSQVDTLVQEKLLALLDNHPQVFVSSYHTL